MYKCPNIDVCDVGRAHTRLSAGRWMREARHRSTCSTDHWLVDAMSFFMELPILHVLIVDGSAGCWVPLTSTLLCTHASALLNKWICVDVSVRVCVCVRACSHAPKWRRAGAHFMSVTQRKLPTQLQFDTVRAQDKIFLSGAGENTLWILDQFPFGKFETAALRWSWHYEIGIYLKFLFSPKYTLNGNGNLIGCRMNWDTWHLKRESNWTLCASWCFGQICDWAEETAVLPASLLSNGDHRAVLCVEGFFWGAFWTGTASRPCALKTSSIHHLNWQWIVVYVTLKCRKKTNQLWLRSSCDQSVVASFTGPRQISTVYQLWLTASWHKSSLAVGSNLSSLPAT